eukprot:6462005-Amphidinium_carterae.2
MNCSWLMNPTCESTDQDAKHVPAYPGALKSDVQHDFDSRRGHSVGHVPPLLMDSWSSGGKLRAALRPLPPAMPPSLSLAQSF